MLSSVRMTTLRGLAAGLALVALNSLGLCNTWIVDQLNGPGTNFIDIPPAIAAAAPGDVILVRPGTYASFTLSRGMSILGQGVVKTSGDIVVSSVPVGEVAVICNVEPVTVLYNEIRISTCAGAVLLQRVDTSISVNGSADVRIFDSTNGVQPIDSLAAVRIVDSRAQVAQSVFHGAHGLDAFCQYGYIGEPGAHAVQCSGVSRVHFARSTATGGDGGHSDYWCGLSGGTGGHGIYAFGNNVPFAPLELIVTGGGVGQAIGGLTGDPVGSPGQSMIVGPNTIAWSSQMVYLPTAPWVSPGGTLLFAPTVEPTLEMIGTAAPGGMITLRLHAEPGTVARLNLGKTPIVQATPGILVEALVQKERSFDRGIVPPSGVIDSVWSFAPGAPPGKLLIFQARLVDPISGLAQRSNSIEAIVP